MIVSANELIVGLNKFIQLIEQDSESRVIKKILRVKNTFGGMKYWGDDLHKYTYTDVKLNCVVQNAEGLSILAEIQFIINFMQIAKNKGHKFYGNFLFICVYIWLLKWLICGFCFCCSCCCCCCCCFSGISRNEDYFIELSNRMGAKYERSDWIKMIVDQNYNELSTEILFGSLENAHESIYKDLTYACVRNNNWERGIQLLKIKLSNLDENDDDKDDDKDDQDDNVMINNKMNTMSSNIDNVNIEYADDNTTNGDGNDNNVLFDGNEANAVIVCDDNNMDNLNNMSNDNNVNNVNNNVDSVVEENPFETSKGDVV